MWRGVRFYRRGFGLFYVWGGIFLAQTVNFDHCLNLVTPLSENVSSRFLPEQDDPRYELLLSKWPLASVPFLQVLTLFAFQGLLITVLSLPFALMAQNLLPYFCTYEVFGLLIWMGGLLGKQTPTDN